MDGKALEKRAVKRTKMVVGLRVLGQSQAADRLVHTLNISSTGALIGAVHEWIEPGSILTLQRKHARTQCQVMWSRAIAPGEVLIGVEFMSNKANFWGFDLDEQGAGVWLTESQR